MKVPQPDPLDAAKAYVEMMKKSQAVEAFDLFWDPQSTARAIYRDRWDQIPESERRRCVELLDAYLRPFMTSDELVRGMIDGSVSGFRDKKRFDSTVDVSYKWTLGDREAAPILRMARTTDGWKIFDKRSGGSSVVDTLREQLRKMADNTGPVVFVRQLQADARLDAEDQQNAAPGR